MRARGILRKFLFHTSLLNNQSRLYSPTAFRRRTPIRHSNRKQTTKRVKSTDDKSKDPETYMRDKISNIYRILKYSTWDSAQQQLDSLPLKWDSYTVNRVLKTHPPLQKAWLFFNWVSKAKGFKHDHFTYTTMLDMFGEAGKISSMEYVFQFMQDKGVQVDAVTYTSMMHWLANCGDVDGSVRIWGEMKERGCSPTVVSYTAYMKILIDGNRVMEASIVYKEMIGAGHAPTCHTYTVLMEYLVGCGKYDEALDMFHKMQDAGTQPDKATCNILVEKFCKVGEIQPIKKILHFMKENRLVLRYPVFMLALETFSNAQQSDQLLRQVNPHFADEGLSKEETESAVASTDDSSTIDRGVLLMLLKKQSLVAVDQLLVTMEDRNAQLDQIIISIIIEVNCARLRANGALLAYNYSKKMGISLEKSAYLALLGFFIRSGNFEKVVDAFKEMLRAGHYPGPYLATLLIYRLGCARRPNFAANIFGLLPDDHMSVATYTALMAVYFIVGSPDKALTIYEDMISKDIRPALGTYDLILVSLEQSGGTCEVERFRNEKKRRSIDINSENTVSMEERICDLLFGRSPVC